MAVVAWRGGRLYTKFVLSHSTGRQEDIRWVWSPIGAVGCNACVLKHSTAGQEDIQRP